MKKIVKPRQSGKTIEAIRIASETGAYLIVHSMDEVVRVVHLASSLGLNIRHPVTFDEFLHRGGLRSSRVRNVVIDNADEFLARVFSGLTIEAATWTINDDN